MRSLGIFGDSIIRGVVLDEIRGRYRYLKESFADILEKSAGLEIRNYGRLGCTIREGEKIIEQHADEISKYQFIVLEFGGNDCDMDWKAVSEHPEQPHAAKTPLPDFEATYGKIIEKIRSMGSQPILFSLPPIDSNRYFAWISKGLNAENILNWIGDVDHIYRWQEMYNDAVLKLAAIKNVPLVDIRGAFLEARNYHDLYCGDGIHPNEAGHALITKKVQEFFSAMA
jgi:lysophospholipase L1-like esterase